jgi:tetratricopeptide (TPR) repeat protein
MLSSRSAVTNRKKIILSIVLNAFCAAAMPEAQIREPKQAGSTLQQDYDAAQQFQREGNLDQAGAHYRAFLANALGELAAARAHAGNYGPAASLLDEALALVPDSPELRLEDARVALQSGALAHSETLARDFLVDSRNSGDSHELAEAHQILGRTLLKMNQDQDARKELEAAVALDPSFQNGYDLAVACLDLDDEKCAAQLFTELEASFGDSPEVHMTFGRAYGNSDYTPRAVAEFRKVIAENPRFPGAHYSLAAALLSAGQDETTMLEVEIELNKELAISPNDFLTFAALGRIAASKQKYSEAESYLKRAISLNPKNPDAFLYLGQMYFNTGRADNAKDALHQAILLTTDESRNRFQVQKAHFLMGRILMQEHHVEEAHAEMEIARSFANKGLSQDREKLAGLLANLPQSNSGDAATSSEAAFADNPNNTNPGADQGLDAFQMRLTPAIADSYNNLGAIAATGSNYLDALKYFERAAVWNPSLDGLDFNWGRAAFSASRFSAAIPPLTRYLSSHPDVSGARGALAMSQFMTQDYSACIATLQPAKGDIMSVPQMQYVYAESLVKTGQISSGKERLQALEASHPEIAEVHRGLGEVHELQGERQNAINELQNAIRLNANDPEAHFDLGKTELENGDLSAAIPELESAVRLLPGDAGFHRELAVAYEAALRPADAEKQRRISDTLAASQLQSAKTATGSHEAKTP